MHHSSLFRHDDPTLLEALDGSVGFELEVQARRPTFKLSQNKTVGSPAIAELMRRLAP